ncbi:hypothetical protein BKA82DRAFT_163667 [Pisolithus tinctorius]|uniref:Uncharacterized protein n=1 Tax=Pisolithus tinctorius Marx 270 TaxID=870435 RepID=A0A0C3NLQ0_PISTI|nr:hypothetical protein BKA82DRAFT_163667 [Pisolithus tinctorius]KIN96233.1 hypothetical protein M404DRAFT_163667 [Pisolithus tinctorius Marx 270]
MSLLTGTDLSESRVASEAPVSSSSVVENLKDSTVAIYTALPNLVAHAEFFFSRATGDVTVLKDGTDDVMELVLSGMFEIDCQGFFMSPEGGYTAKNAFGCDFVETKLTCNLLTVQCDSVYSSTQQDFVSIISNIRALEKLMPMKKGETLLSCIRESRGQPCIRLSHALFNKKDDQDDLESMSCNGISSHDCDSEMATAEWPVQEILKDTLIWAASTHYISPLPAFDIDGIAIEPVDYHRLLCGAIVQVHFAILHFFIKGDRKSVFTTAAREICVLRAPLQVPVNPLKCMRLSNESSATGNKKSCTVREPHNCNDDFSCFLQMTPSCNRPGGL